MSTTNESVTPFILPPQIFESAPDKLSGRTMMLEGPSGVGKTKQAEFLMRGGWGLPGMNVLYVSTERKFKSIEHMRPKVWPIKSYDFPLDAQEKASIQASSEGYSLIDVFDYLRRMEHPHDAVYFDSFMRYTWRMLEMLIGNTFTEKGERNTLAAYGLFARKMRVLFDKLGDLTDASVSKKPVHFIGTWGIERGVDFEGRKMHMPIVGGQQVAQSVNYYFDDVLHLRRQEGQYVAQVAPDHERDAKVSSPVELPEVIVNPNLFQIIGVLEGKIAKGQAA